jgi:hypothetical protein
MNRAILLMDANCSPELMGGREIEAFGEAIISCPGRTLSAVALSATVAVWVEVPSRETHGPAGF